MSLKNMRRSLHPRVRAASSISEFRFSNAPRALRYISGKATTTAAMTVACQLNIKGKPIESNHCPTGLLLPKASSKMKPQTVGGSTMGMVNTTSMKFCHLLGMRRENQAARMPKMKMMTIAVSVVFKVTHSGDQSSPSKKFTRAPRLLGA